MEKNKGGRPSLTTKDLQPNWKECIINLSKQGASIVELAVELNISRTTLYSLCEKDEEFMNTIKECKRYCEAWWVAKGRTELENKEFSYTGWYMNMKNRFGWTDRQDITSKNEKVDGGIPISKWIEDNTEKND